LQIVFGGILSSSFNFSRKLERTAFCPTVQCKHEQSSIKKREWSKEVMIGLVVLTYWEIPAGEDEHDSERLRHHHRARREGNQRRVSLQSRNHKQVFEV
jgi:hypothetical protein